jgi:hypothetical protein
VRMPRPWRLALAAALAVLGAYCLRVVLWRPFTVAGSSPEDGFVRVSGVVHVHTTASDGGGTPEEVMNSAAAAGLQFVAITDHNHVDLKSLEGYRKARGSGPGRDLLVLVGGEFSTNAGYVLGLNVPDTTFRFSRDVRDVLQDVQELGGVAFANHAVSPRPEFTWTGWEEPGDWGLELLNSDSQWRSAGWGRLFHTAALYGLNRRYALLTSLSSPDPALARWDALLRERDVAGIVGADAHSRIPVWKGASLRFPAYEALFDLMRNHVLLEQPLTGAAADDATTILRALARGRSYVGVDALAPANGFSFVAERGASRWTMGDDVAADGVLRLRAGGSMPKGARLSLLRDGHVIAESAGSLLRDEVGPGIYRIEVRVPGWSMPWVLSNPIYVFDEATTARRRQRAAWPSETAAPPPALVLDSFDGPTPWTSAADSSSWVDQKVVDPNAGEDGRGAARLAFRLGGPTAAHPHTFCALVDWTHRDLSGRKGLVFNIRADGVYRIWVQVRDLNPASADDSTEWWFASVRTSRQWRRVAVPFSRLRSVNPRTDGRLDLDKVRALVFVLDRGAVKTGTAGSIWIDELGVY